MSPRVAAFRRSSREIVEGERLADELTDAVADGLMIRKSPVAERGNRASTWEVRSLGDFSRLGGNPKNEWC